MISDYLEKYLLDFVEPESELLKKIQRETYLYVLRPHMLSGHYQGRILSFLSKLIAPQRILEIGTFTGYATLCLAEGLRSDGLIYTIDVNEELQAKVQQYFDASAYKNQIQYIIANATEWIPNTDETWDLVFIDADKKNNETYFNQVVDRVRTNGIIIVDNVLWKGKIVAGATDKDSNQIRDFNEIMKSDPRVEQLILPVRDGLMVLRKK